MPPQCTAGCFYFPADGVLVKPAFTPKYLSLAALTRAAITSSAGSSNPCTGVNAKEVARPEVWVLF